MTLKQKMLSFCIKLTFYLLLFILEACRCIVYIEYIHFYIWLFYWHSNNYCFYMFRSLTSQHWLQRLRPSASLVNCFMVWPVMSIRHITPCTMVASSNINVDMVDTSACTTAVNDTSFLVGPPLPAKVLQHIEPLLNTHYCRGNYLQNFERNLAPWGTRVQRIPDWASNYEVSLNTYFVTVKSVFKC